MMITDLFGALFCYKTKSVPNGASLRMDVSKTGAVPERELSQAFMVRTTVIA